MMDLPTLGNFLMIASSPSSIRRFTLPSGSSNSLSSGCTLWVRSEPSALKKWKNFLRSTQRHCIVQKSGSLGLVCDTLSSHKIFTWVSPSHNPPQLYHSCSDLNLNPYLNYTFLKHGVRLFSHPSTTSWRPCSRAYVEKFNLNLIWINIVESTLIIQRSLKSYVSIWRD